MRRRFIRNRKAVDEYFTIESLEDECVISLTEREGMYEGLGLHVFYSINNSHWKFDNLSKNPITLKKGYKVRFKNDDVVGTFVITKKCKILGSIMSLCFMDDFKDKTSLGSYQFSWLFKGCNTIVSVDKGFLPATTLSENCYLGMFYGCTNLVEAPILSATILAYKCYDQMFYGCTKLNYIKMLATDISSDYCLWNWVYNVSPTGTFVKNKDATWDVRGVNGIPNGWEVIDDTFPTNEEGMPESTTFDFPLYFNTQIVEQTDDFLYRSNSGDLIQVYREFIRENANDSTEWEIPERLINDYPVYIDGYRMVSGIYYYNNIENIVTAKDYGNYNELYIYIDEAELFVEGYN